MKTPALLLSTLSCLLAGAALAAPDHLSVADFGALPDDGVPDALAIQKAIDLAQAGPIKTVYFPAGAYDIEQELVIGNGGYSQAMAVRLTGQWATLRAVAPITSILYVRVASHLKIERLAFAANRMATHGIRAFKMSGRDATLEQVDVHGATSHGVLLRACQGALFRGVSSFNNGDRGFSIEGSNASVFDGCKASSNQGDGFFVSGLVHGAERYSGGCSLRDVWSEGNRGRGLVLERDPALHYSHVNGMRVSGGWLEGNRGDAVGISAWNVSIDGLRVVSGGGANTKAIRLSPTARAARITGNHFANGGVNDFSQVYVQGSPSWHSIEGNFMMYLGAPIPVVQGP